MQTTSPFRKYTDIKKAYNQFVRKKLNSIVSVSHVTFKNNQVIFDSKRRIINSRNILKNKNKILVINGAIYITKVNF